MKYLTKSNHTVVLVFLSLFLTTIACSTTGMQRSEDVQSTMKNVDNDIKRIVVQLDAIGSSLNELTKLNQADRKKAFDLFSDNASEIKNMRRDFVKHSTEMEASRKAYLKRWDSDKQNYDNPDIQRQSNQRREALGQTFDKIAQNNVGVNSAFENYVSDINEIQRFLSNDLTSDGIDAISNTADNVNDNGAYLKKELKNLQDAIEEARVEMRQS